MEDNMKTWNTVRDILWYLLTPEDMDQYERASHHYVKSPMTGGTPQFLEMAKALFWWFAAVILPIVIFG